MARAVDGTVHVGGYAFEVCGTLHRAERDVGIMEPYVEVDSFTVAGKRWSEKRAAAVVARAGLMDQIDEEAQALRWE